MHYDDDRPAPAEPPPPLRPVHAPGGATSTEAAAGPGGSAPAIIEGLSQYLSQIPFLFSITAHIR